ncbi:MAG: hypothetical protein U1F43_06430 [Myxococcota bacterium]
MRARQFDRTLPTTLVDLLLTALVMLPWVGACGGDASAPPDTASDALSDTRDDGDARADAVDTGDAFEDGVGADVDVDARVDDVVDDATVSDDLEGDAPGDGAGDSVALNQAPTIALIEPADGARFAWHAPVTLRAQVSDDADPPSQLAVTWSSPIQGLLFDGAPDADGVVEVSTSGLVLGVHALTLHAVDRDGAEASAELTVEVVADAGAPTLELAPSDAMTADDLVARVLDPRLDAVAGPLAVTWSWFRGSEAVAIVGDTVPAAQTTKGETWRVQAVVSNGVVETPPGVAQVTIRNSPPSCDAAAIAPRHERARLRLWPAPGRRRRRPGARPLPLDRRRRAGRSRARGRRAPPARSLRWRRRARPSAARSRPSTATTRARPSRRRAWCCPTPTATRRRARRSRPSRRASLPEYAFTCTLAAPAVDAEGDAIDYSVAWAVNDFWNAGAAATVVPARDLTTAGGGRPGDGDALRCRIVASDGKAESQSAPSAAVVLGTQGVSLGGALGDVALDEPLGDGCWKGADHALPECVPGVVCAVDVTACFAADGTLRAPPTIAADVTLPGLGDVHLEGAAGGDDGAWCIQGAASDPAPSTLPLPLGGLTLTLCSGADGAAAVTLGGQIRIDGESYAFSDALVSVSGGLGLAVPLPAFRLDGTRFGGTLTFASGEDHVGFSGAVTLAGIGDLPVSGGFDLAAGAFVAGQLTAAGGADLAGIDFAGPAVLSLDGGAWHLALSGGSLALPGGSDLALAGTAVVVAGQLQDTDFAPTVAAPPSGPSLAPGIGAGFVFAGASFGGEAHVRWSRGTFTLSLEGGLLGPEGPSFTLSGAVEIAHGKIVSGDLDAGADLAVAGVQFVGRAAVTWQDHVLRVALQAGVVGLPDGTSVSLGGAIELTDGALTSASFDGSGFVALAGVRFGGALSASWSGGKTWSLAVSDGRVELPGGQVVTLAGALSVVDGRVVAGSFADGADVAFAGVQFAGQVSGSYAASYDDLGNRTGEELSLGLAGGKLGVAGTGELTLSGAVVIAQGAVASASFAAGSDVQIGPIRFAGAATVEYDAADQALSLVVAGGRIDVAGASLTVGGRVHIEGGALACGELQSAAAASAAIGGVAFDLGIRYAGAGKTCAWSDGTTTVSEQSQFIASLADGHLDVGPVQLTLAGNATLSGGTLACASLDVVGGAAVPVAGVGFAAGARYAAAGFVCPWTDGVPAVGGTLELTLSHGKVEVGGQSVSLSGAAQLVGGVVESASFHADAALDLPGGAHGFEVGASYVRAGSHFELSLSSGQVEVAGATFTLAGEADIIAGKVGCVVLHAGGSATVDIGSSSLVVGARLAAAGAQCDWMAEPATASTLEVTLAGDVTLGGASHAFSGAGQVVGGRLACAELSAASSVALPIAEASFDVGIRYAAGGATCDWADGTQTTAAAPTLLASLSNGQLTVGGALMTLSGTGELSTGALTCVELRAGGSASFAVGGVSFDAGARFAAAGATCAWTDAAVGPAAVDTLEATLHDGRVAVAGAQLVLSGTATVASGAVRCADLTLDAGADLAFGGIAFAGHGQYSAAGASCHGAPAAATDTLALTLDDGAVDVAGTSVTLSGSGEISAGRVACIAFSAAGGVPSLGGLAVTVGGYYAAAGATCPGAPGPVTVDTFALSLAASGGVAGATLAMNGYGRVDGGKLACAELNASGAASDLAGVTFDVGAHYTAAGRACTWQDGSETVAEDKNVVVATLRNGTLTVGSHSLSLAGEGELVGGALTCATLSATGASTFDLGGVTFSAGARYAAAGQSCGWSDGGARRLQLTLDDGSVTVGETAVHLSGSAEIAGKKLACATFASQVGTTVDVAGVSFAVGARYAAAGESCGWPDAPGGSGAAAERFELTLADGVLSVGSDSFALAGRARLEDRVMTCAELTSSGALALGGTTFTVGGRYIRGGNTCAWSDGSSTSAAVGTLSLFLSGGRVTVAGHTLDLSGEAVVRNRHLACAELDAAATFDVDVAGVAFALGGARWISAGETCTWADGTETTAPADTFTLSLRDGRLTVGDVTLTLSGSAELTGGTVACADLQAGGSAKIDVGGVSFDAGARFAAAGHTCGWSDGDANTFEVTLRNGSLDAGDARLGLSGTAAIAGGKLTCADFDVTSGAALAFGGVSFAAGARFAAQGQTCGWSDGARNQLELLLKDGAIDVGGAVLHLSGAGTIAGGKVTCATMTSSANGQSEVGGIAFDVTGRFAAKGETCAWSAGPVAANTFDLLLDHGSMTVGPTHLALAGAGTVAGGKLTCAELDTTGGATADLAGIHFDLGARYAAAGETCTWRDGSTTSADASIIRVALRNGTLDVGGRTLTLSGTATLEGGAIACAELDAVGQGQIDLAGVSFAGGARYAAAGHACAWTDGPVPENVLDLTLEHGRVDAGGVSVGLSGAATIVGGHVACADLAADAGASLDLGGLAFDAHARFAAAGSTCGWSAGTADQLELVLDGASLTVGQTQVALTGSGAIEDGEVHCLSFAAAGKASLGGLSFDVGARFAAAGATCDWTDGPVATRRFEVTLGGASVTLDGVGTLALSGSGRVEGSALQCAELSANGSVTLGGVAFDIGARYAKGGASCVWADGTRTDPSANTFTFALNHGALAVGPVTLELSGAATVVAGSLTCAELDAAGGATVDVAGVTFDGGARYLGAGRTCAWRDGTTTSASVATLQLTLRDGLVTVGADHVSLSGTGEIAGGALTCASFDVSGTVAIAGLALAASGHYAAADHDCGAWDQTNDAELVLTGQGSLDIDGHAFHADGALAVVNRRVTSGHLGLDGSVVLAGLPIAPTSGQAAGALDYAASYDAAGALVSQSLRLALSGRVAIDGLGSFDASGSGAIVDRELEGITLHLGASLTLDGALIEAQSVDLVYQRQDPTAGGASTLALALVGGRVVVTGLGELAVSGRSRFVGGALAELRLDVATDLTLADVVVSGGASLSYDGGSRTLELVLDHGSASVAGLGSLSLSGRAALSAGALDALELAVTGDLAIGGVAVQGRATLAYQRVDPATLGPSLHLALTQARMAIDPLGQVSVAGSVAIARGALESFEVAITTQVTLGGVPLSGGLSLAYSGPDRRLTFRVDDASATVAGLGSLTVSGSAVIEHGGLASLTLGARGDLTIAGVALTGQLALEYLAADRSLSFTVDHATLAIAGLDASITASGEARLQAGRLTLLSLAVAGGASIAGVPLSGSVSLDYSVTYDALGAVATRSLSLALNHAEFTLPGVSTSVVLAGRLAIENGQVTCADFGPATVSLTGLSAQVNAYYVAAGQRCGHLTSPAPAKVFAGSMRIAFEVLKQNVVASGSAAIVGGHFDQLTLTASVDFSGVPGLQRATLTGSLDDGELCFVGDVRSHLTLPLGGRLDTISAHFCAVGRKVSSVGIDVRMLAPNAVGEPLELLARAVYTGAESELTASVCLASEDPDGASCCAGIDASCPAVAWHPFSGGVLTGLPPQWAGLAVRALSGSVTIGLSRIGFAVRGDFDASAMPPIIPGLELKDLAVSLSASVGSTTAIAAGVRGVIALPLGDEPVDVAVEGAFDASVKDGLALSLKGSIGDPASGVSANVEPLKAFIGENTFEIAYVNVAVSASTKSGVSATLAGGANITLPAPLSIGPIGLQLAGHVQVGQRSGFYVTGAICGIVLPAGLLPAGFDAIPLGGPSPCADPTVVVAVASRAYPEVTIAPNTTIKRGLTLATTIPMPKAVSKALGLDSTPAGPQQAPNLFEAPKLPTIPSVVAEVGVDTSGIRLKGALNIPWQIIRPDWNLPAIRLLQLNELAFQVRLSSSPALMFTGSVLFQPNHCIPDYQSFVEAGLASDQSPFEAFDPAKIKCLDLPAPFRAMPQQTALTGSATLRYMPPKEFGGEIYLHGMWYEPFFIPNLGIASPGLTVDIRLVDGPYGVQIPVPTSLGVNGDVFWKRPYYDAASAHPVYPIACHSDADCTGFGNCEGGACPAACEDGPDGDALPDTCHYTWPVTCAALEAETPGSSVGAACIDTDNQPATTPASLAHSGATFFYSVYPTPSAILVPLPTVIVRRELDNLDSLDLIPAVDELKDGARNLLRWAEDRVPGVSHNDSPFPPCVDLDGDGQLDKSLSCLFPATPLPNVLKDLPVGIALDKARIYFSTHERELFGVTFSPGIRADLDAKLTAVGAPSCDATNPCTGGLTCDHGTCKREVFMAGSLGPDGLSIEGRASPLSLLDAVTIKGDPFTKFADTHGLGYVEVPTDPALAPLPATVEAWYRHSATAPGQWQSILRQVGASGDGYEILVGDPAPRCDAHYDACDSGPCGQIACEGPLGPCSDDSEDGAALAAAKSKRSFDLGATIAASAAACPQDGSLAACAAGAVSNAVAASGGSGLGATCATCLTGFATCEQRASVRVDVWHGGAVTRTVRSALPVVPMDAWSHVAATFDDARGSIGLYVDGAVVDSLDDGGRPVCDAACGCDAACAGDPQSIACSGCRDDLGVDAAGAHAACMSCRSAADAWRAAAPALGRWSAPGAGATLRMGDGVDAVDDVRLWNVVRTADQIAAQRSALTQDGSPEILGDCSNAGPGKCDDQRACDGDLDCATGACHGAIARGTCRVDGDCSGGATCGGFVPATQRYAFDTSLIARYEFDYDSYKSLLGHAWNTRYRGDPDGGLDCAAAPELAPEGVCDLIGQPCKDYDLDSPFKLHARYMAGARWVTAIDAPDLSKGADDLFFRLNVPFGAGILSQGGLGIRGGVAFTLPAGLPAPDALTNGGARIDVNVAGTSEARGELYTKPFDLLGLGFCTASTQRCTSDSDCKDPVLGFDDATFCRGDGFCTAGPCIGRLELSGYGPNGIDDGIDDGFYARTNLHAKPGPTFAASARISTEARGLPRKDLAYASYDLGCPPGQTCQSFADYRLAMATGLDLDLPLPFTLYPGGPAELFKICGNAVISKPGKGDPTPAWVTASRELCPNDGQIPSFGAMVNGSIDVLSQSLRGSALLTNCGFEVRSAMDLGQVHIGDFQLPSIGTMTGDVTGRFVPFRVCTDGHLTLNLGLPDGAPAKLLDLHGEVTSDVCVGEATKYAGKDSGQFIRLLSGRPDGTPAPTNLKFLSLDGGPSLFEMNGTVDLCAGNGDLVGQPGVAACADDHLRVCGDLQLLGGLIKVENKCLEVRVPHLDVTFSMHQAVSIDLAGILPSSQSEIFIEMCAKGKNATWSDAEQKVVCTPTANSEFKMTLPMVRLRFRSDLDVIGGKFGNVDVNLVADFAHGASFSGKARWVSGTSTAFGFDHWAPDFCDIDVQLDVPIGGLPHLSAAKVQCSPYCVASSDCVDPGATCQLGKCEVCGDKSCAFGENSLNCPGDCGYPAGTTCPDDDDFCASKNCWSLAEQIPLLSDIGLKRDPGVCLPCLPGTTDCGPGRYCDGFQLFECREKAGFGEFCGMNAACISDKCQFDLLWGGPRCAECTSDAQCGGGGRWCDTFPSLIPTAPDYRCHEPAPIGGKCGVGPSIGATDKNCQPGAFCDVDGTCHAKAPDDTLCTGDRVCSNGHCCFEGAFVCDACCSKDDCAPGFGCYPDRQGIGHGNECRKGDDGELCKVDDECGSNHCVLGICTTPVPNGSLCGADEACQSTHCCGGLCGGCCAKVDCADAQDGCYPVVPDSIIRVCRPGQDGEACADAAECAGDGCTNVGPLAGTCYTPHSKHNWQECTTGDECDNSQQCFLHGFSKLCHCERHDQCPGGFCDLGGWNAFTTDGKCGDKQPAGAYCEDDVWCQAGLVCSEQKCVAPASKHNWESCTSDAECIGGECWTDGRCRCTSHADCTSDLGANSYCDMGSWLPTNEEGRCHAPKQPSNVAAYCEDGSWCQSGLCTYSGRQVKNICYTPLSLPAGATCDINEHCASGVCDPLQGYKCTAPPNSQRNWESCTADSQCQHGKCYAGVCRCESHAQCQSELGGDSYCDLGPWLAGNEEGRCHSPKVASNIGAYCEDGTWCASGLCTFSGRRVQNICYTPLALPGGSLCDINEHCASGYCDPNAGYHCSAVGGSTPNWGGCSADSDCAHGKCFGGVCRCESHAQCTAELGGDSYCDLGIWLTTNQEGQCHGPRNGVDAYCEDDQWCTGGLKCVFWLFRGNLCSVP